MAQLHGNQLGGGGDGQPGDAADRRSVIAGALQQQLQQALTALWSLPQVGDIRQVGLIAGVELVRDWRTRAPFDLREQAGIRVCQAMARRGVLTRPIGNVVVVVPPYCTSGVQVERMGVTLTQAIGEVF